MGKDYLGKDMRRGGKEAEEKEEKEIKSLDEGDIALLKTYGQGQYSKSLKQVETDISEITKRVNELAGIKESDTGLGPPALWDLAADKQTLQSEQPLQVARCTKVKTQHLQVYFHIYIRKDSVVMFKFLKIL